MDEHRTDKQQNKSSIATVFNDERILLKSKMYTYFIKTVLQIRIYEAHFYSKFKKQSAVSIRKVSNFQFKKNYL